MNIYFRKIMMIRTLIGLKHHLPREKERERDRERNNYFFTNLPYFEILNRRLTFYFMFLTL